MNYVLLKIGKVESYPPNSGPSQHFVGVIKNFLTCCFIKFTGMETINYYPSTPFLKEKLQNIIVSGKWTSKY